MSDIKSFLKTDITGKSSSEIKENFGDIWEDIIKKAENNEDGFYRERYFNSNWGEYYRYKSK